MCFLRFILVLILMILPLSSYGDQTEAKKKVKTIDELAAMYDSNSCKECHPDIYEQWEKSLHARSIFGVVSVGRTAATFKTTIENGLKEWPNSGVKKSEDVKIKHFMICAKCHLPQLIESEDSVAYEIVKNLYAFKEIGDDASKNLQKLNIGCLICHNRNAIIHKWTDGYPENNAVYGAKSGDHSDPSHPVMKESKIMKESILCGQCHGLGPNFELENPTQCATLYGSYLWSYRAEGGTETCQECHIQKSKLGHNMQSYRSPEMAKMAIDFDVEAYGHYWRDGSKIIPQAFVKVELTNNAGHAIPDG
ncbi:MAG: cytochrome C [Nitrospirae bacterium]|nr:cytochrome C [Nitrospirota bacterium]